MKLQRPPFSEELPSSGSADSREEQNGTKAAQRFLAQQLLTVTNRFCLLVGIHLKE